MSNPLIDELKKHIADFHHEPKAEAVGTVLEVGDGVARVAGLSEVMASEMVEFENGVRAMGQIHVDESAHLENGMLMQPDWAPVRLPAEGIPYPVLVFCGMLPWQFFATAFAESGSSLVSNSVSIRSVPAAARPPCWR